MATKPVVRVPSNLVGPAYTTDGYQNFVSRIGHGKASAGTYAATYSNHAEIINAYKTSWLGKIIDIKAEDSVREWRNWIANDDEIELIEAEESRLQLRQKIMEADKQAMLRGGSAILMGGLPGKPDTPLAPDRIAQGGLKYLTVLTRDQIKPSERIGDPMDPNYGKARDYSLEAGGVVTRVHPSRVIIFTSQPKPDADVDWDGGWGDPVWSGLKSAITNADAVATGIAEMIQEAKIDVIGIPGLMANLATQEYENQLMRRIQLMNMMKSLVNAWVKDAGDSEGKGGETFEQKQLNFAGLPDIWDRSWMELSGKSDIPQTRLLGRAPQGMNATGDSDAKNYAAMVKARQEMKLQPTIAPLDEALIWSALGKRPKEIWYQWRSLYQISEKEGAEVEKMYGEAFRSRLDSSAFADDMLAKAELNRMVESGRYPGIEDAISEADNDGITDPEEAEAKELERMTAEAEIAAASAPKVIKDAAPRTLYVRRDVVNRADIVKWATAQGFTDIVPDLHVTIAYSRTAVDWFKVGTSWSPKLEIAAGGPRQIERLGPDGKYIALLITADELVWRHDEIIRKGASWDWPDYQPHISIQIGGKMPAVVDAYQGKIVLGPEIFEEVRTEK